MPVFPPQAPQVYDTVYSVITAAKARLNDVIETLEQISPQLLRNHSVFTQQVFNNGWRKLQEFMANLGNARFYDERAIIGLPPTTNLDPASQVWIDWFNYFDGNSLFTTPVLPGNMAFPLLIGERQSGTQTPFVPMESILDRFPQPAKQWANGCWQWRADKVYMPGALGAIDLYVRFGIYLGDFVDTGDLQWFQQNVPMVRCQDPLSLYICAEIAANREDMDEEAWTLKAENAAKRWHNRDIRMKQRVNVRRMSRSGRLEAGGQGQGYGYGDSY